MDLTILDIILSDTYTLSSIKHRVRILKAYLISQIFTSPEYQDVQSNDLIWLRALGKDFYKQFNQSNIYSIFDLIEAKIDKMEPLYVYLPFIADDQVDTAIGQYIRSSVGHNLLYETKFDPNLVAGCGLSFKGVYKDYSLRSKIEAKKSEILDSFKKFLR